MLRDVKLICEEARKAEIQFETVLLKHYPQADRFVWYRACEAVEKNTADKFDIQMAENKEIEKAHDLFIKLIHEYYRARDGEKGVLGGRGL